MPKLVFLLNIQRGLADFIQTACVQCLQVKVCGVQRLSDTIHYACILRMHDVCGRPGLDSGWTCISNKLPWCDDCPAWTSSNPSQWVLHNLSYCNIMVYAKFRADCMQMPMLMHQAHKQRCDCNRICKANSKTCAPWFAHLSGSTGTCNAPDQCWWMPVRVWVHRNSAVGYCVVLRTHILVGLGYALIPLMRIKMEGNYSS